jgi:GT2 family glycosyltransferase
MPRFPLNATVSPRLPSDHDPCYDVTAERGAGQRRSTISVVVCAYTERRWSALSEALASVLAQSPPPLEAIAVIDHNDTLRDRVRDAFPQVQVIANAETQGLSGARNTGLDHARGDIVAFLDDDAVAESGWLAALTEAYSDPQVVGTGGVVLPLWKGRKPPWLPDEFLWVVGCTYRGVPERAMPIRNPIGANMSLRREPCLVAGGFSSGLGRVGRTPLGCEETELAIRLRQEDAAAIVLHVPRARVHHEVGPERQRWSYYVARCWSEGISKAIVSRLVGAEAALSAERRYVTRTLPTGAMRAVGQGLRGDRWALLRAGALLVGVGVTAAGYVRGSVARMPAPPSDRA